VSIPDGDASTPPQPRLYIATDDHKTVVARDRPRIDGNCRTSTAGVITLLEAVPLGPAGDPPRAVASSVETSTPSSHVSELLAALAAGVVLLICLWWVLPNWLGIPLGVIAGVGVVTAVWMLSPRQHVRDRKWRDSHVLLTHPDDREAIRQTWMAAESITLSWPQLRGIPDLPFPGPRIAEQIWVAARCLSEQASLRTLQADLSESLPRQPARTEMQESISSRLDRASEQLFAAETRAAAEVGLLTEMQANCTALQREQHAVDEGAHLILKADTLLGQDSAEELSDPDKSLESRRSAVLRAYFGLPEAA
jgi:hypothetical protein